MNKKQYYNPIAGFVRGEIFRDLISFIVLCSPILLIAILTNYYSHQDIDKNKTIEKKEEKQVSVPKIIKETNEKLDDFNFINVMGGGIVNINGDINIE